jgi:hypothetical protein
MARPPFGRKRGSEAMPTVSGFEQLALAGEPLGPDIHRLLLLSNAAVIDARFPALDVGVTMRWPMTHASLAGIAGNRNPSRRPV